MRIEFESLEEVKKFCKDMGWLKEAAHKVIEPKVVEPKVVEPKAVEPKVVEPKVIEPKVIEPKVVKNNITLEEVRKELMKMPDKALLRELITKYGGVNASTIPEENYKAIIEEARTICNTQN